MILMGIGSLSVLTRVEPSIAVEHESPQINSGDVQLSSQELKANPAIQARLIKARQIIKANHYNFHVGITSVSGRNLAEITGARPPSNLQQEAVKQNALASQKILEFEKIRQRKLPQIKAKNASVLATAFDWRSLGMVTPVKDQGSCGSCWDFGTIGAWEANVLIRGGGVTNASEQYILNSKKYGTCGGGWYAFGFLTPPSSSFSLGNPTGGFGTASQKEVPYTGQDGTFIPTLTPYQAVTWGYVNPNVDIPSVQELKSALIEKGPLAVAVAATDFFQDYTGGVFDESSNDPINHVVTLVGWDDGKGAWLVKNSWGTGWGENGYIWMKYGSNKIGWRAAWVIAFPPNPKPYGPDTCKQGYVWREASSTDHVCVTPDIRTQAANDNRQAANRRSPNGGPYGPDTCKQGYVWREAFANDHVCVTPQTRSRAADDNRNAASRVVPTVDY